MTSFTAATMSSSTLNPATLTLPAILCACGMIFALPGLAEAQDHTIDSAAVRALVSRGDSAWENGSREAARLFYSEVVRADSVASARVILRLGILESEQNQLKDSEKLLRLYALQEPDDVEGTLALARTLSWAGKLDAAESMYSSIVVRSGILEARKGLARVVSWQGRLEESAQLWRALAELYPDDVEVWVALAQVQRWLGRPNDAESTMHRALGLDPRSAAAADEMQWIQADLARIVEPGVVHTSDSDRNRSTYYSTTLISEPLGGGAGRVRVAGSFRDARHFTSSGTSTAARASITWYSPARSLSAFGEIGAVRLYSKGDAGVPITSSHTRATAALRASAAFRGMRIGVALSHAPFDETVALIVNGLLSTALESEMSLSLPHRITLGVAGSHTNIDGGISNSRAALTGSARWGALPWLTLGASARAVAFDTSGGSDGYFSPHRFSLVEGNARLTVGRTLGWGAALEAGMGEQRIRMNAGDLTRSNAALRAMLTVRVRPAPGFEYEFGYGASSVASPFAREAAEYSATTVLLRGRLAL